MLRLDSGCKLFHPRQLQLESHGFWSELARGATWLKGAGLLRTGLGKDLCQFSQFQAHPDSSCFKELLICSLEFEQVQDMFSQQF